MNPRDQAIKTASRKYANLLFQVLQLPHMRELLSRYVEENPEAANGSRFDLIMHAIIAPLCRNHGYHGHSTRKPEPDKWTEQDSWKFLRYFLMTGACTDGVRLSPAECRLLLQILSGEREPPRERQRDKKLIQRDDNIANYLELLEADEWPDDAAVRKAHDVYGLTESMIWEVKRKRRELGLPIEPRGRNMTAEVRRKMIQFYEREAKERWHRPTRPYRRKAKKGTRRPIRSPI